MTSITYSNTYLLLDGVVEDDFSPGTTVSETVLDGVFDIDAPETLIARGQRLEYLGTNSDGDTFLIAPLGRAVLLTNSSYSIGDRPPPRQEIDLVICFASGTRITTGTGPRKIEDLAVGDLILTRDHGLQPLRWIDRTKITQVALHARPALQPVRIDAGALGNSEAMTVSPNHRMLLTDWRAEALFGAPEVLIAAQDLINDTSIRRVCPEEGVTYWHMLFDTHELVEAEGCWSESLHPTAAAQDHMSAAARAEVLRLFPHLAEAEHAVVRPAIPGCEARAWK